MTDRTQLHQHLGEEAHIGTPNGCAIGYLVSPDIIIARRVFTEASGGAAAWMGVWLVSRNIGFHLGSECPTR